MMAPVTYGLEVHEGVNFTLPKTGSGQGYLRGLYDLCPSLSEGLEEALLPDKREPHTGKASIRIHKLKNLSATNNFMKPSAIFEHKSQSIEAPAAENVESVQISTASFVDVSMRL